MNISTNVYSSIAHCKSKDCSSDEPIKELFGNLKKKADEVKMLALLKTFGPQIRSKPLKPKVLRVLSEITLAYPIL